MAVANEDSTDVTFHLSVRDEVEYNTKLYKAILNFFVNTIPAVQFSECPHISELLLVEELDRVQKKHDREGQNAASRELIDILRRKPNWFDAILKTLDQPVLKLQEFKPKFLALRNEVNTKWMESKKRESGGVTSAGHPTQTSNASTIPFREPVPVSPAGIVYNDFHLSTHSSELPVQSDSDRNHSPTSPDNTTPKTVLNPKVGAGGGEVQGAGARSRRWDRSDIYDLPESSTVQSSVYTQLSHMSLESDAILEVQQVSQQSEQEIGAGAMSLPEQQRQRSHQRQQQPFTRKEHPSLRQALSHKPEKDFEAEFVSNELSSYAGWTDMQDEQQVIQAMRRHCNTDGCYIIWYWALAKRPTVCVYTNRELTTFVVHKSTPEPHKYYFNRKQKQSSSLQRLLGFHLNHGILLSTDTPGANIIVQLTTPYSQ